MVAPALRLAVDVMGGDDGPAVTLPAVFQFLAEHEQLQMLLFGSACAFEEPAVAASLARFRTRIRAVTCAEEVAMGDKPAHALRHKQQSSMYQSVLAVNRGEADACVSAGNSGALMAIATRELGTFPGVDRPALCARVPTMTGHCLMLDLGANVDCKPAQLAQFAAMGSEMAKVVSGIAAPRVALLNIGEETGKGNALVREAHALLSSCDNLNYSGFAEGNDIFRGSADVVVCDGFVGNAVLKASEGVAALIGARVREALAPMMREVGHAPGFGALLERIHPAHYNGATLLGLRRVTVASHGKTDVAGFAQAIALACQQAALDLPGKIQLQLSNTFL